MAERYRCLDRYIEVVETVIYANGDARVKARELYPNGTTTGTTTWMSLEDLQDFWVKEDDGNVADNKFSVEAVLERVMAKSQRMNEDQIHGIRHHLRAAAAEAVMATIEELRECVGTYNGHRAVDEGFLDAIAERWEGER